MGAAVVWCGVCARLQSGYMSGIERRTNAGARAAHRETAKAKCRGISLEARGEQLNNCIPT